MPDNSKLLLDLKRDLQELKKGVAEIRGLLVNSVSQVEQQQSPLPVGLLSVPPVLERRFRDALVINKPDSFVEVADFPLKESFDALFFHLGEVK